VLDLDCFVGDDERDDGHEGGGERDELHIGREEMVWVWVMRGLL
jgi:hypothetical protein